MRTKSPCDWTYRIALRGMSRVAPLRALANPVTPNGVYAYGPASGFPSNSFNSTNYWVDVVFAPSP